MARGPGPAHMMVLPGPRGLRQTTQLYMRLKYEKINEIGFYFEGVFVVNVLLPVTLYIEVSDVSVTCCGCC